MGKTTITKKGIRLLVKLAASGKALSFTRVTVGTGSLPDGVSPEDMEGLNSYKMDGVLASCNASENTAAIIFQVSSINVEHDFIVTEAGLFANDPDLGEILYTYLDMSEDPQYVYSQGSSISKFLEITLNVVIGTEVNVTAVINPGSLVKRDDFDAAEARIDKLETPKFDDVGEDIPDYQTAFNLIKSNTTISSLLTAIKSVLKFSGAMVESLEAKKMDTAGGDISNTKIVTMDNIAAEFPVPVPGDTGAGFAGKVRKFISDFNLYKTGIITLGKLVNNAQTTEAGFALDARMGKTLYDLYSELNSDLIGALAWTNPNPTATFAPQTINVDDSYDYVEILYQRDMTSKYIRSQKIYKMATDTPLTHHQVGGPRNILYERFCHISGRAIYFDIGRYQYTDNNAFATDNSVIIPLYIVGYHTSLFG